jgi:hypothetical protein
MMPTALVRTRRGADGSCRVSPVDAPCATTPRLTAYELPHPVDAVEDHLKALRANAEAGALDVRRRAHEFAEQRVPGLRSEAALAEGLEEGV